MRLNVGSIFFLDFKEFLIIIDLLREQARLLTSAFEVRNIIYVTFRLR